MFYAKLNYLHKDRGMTLTVFEPQNPVRCDKLRKPMADQRKQQRQKVKPMQNGFLSPLNKFEPNSGIRSEYCAGILAEYSFWCQRKTISSLMTSLGRKFITRGSYATKLCHFERSEEVHTTNITATGLVTLPDLKNMLRDTWRIIFPAGHETWLFWPICIKEQNTQHSDTLCDM